MSSRTLVNPRFPARLRQLRKQRGLSLRDMYDLTYVGKSTISEFENGHTNPSAETAALLDRALGADGELAGMIREAPAPEPAHAGAVEYALARPMRLDKAGVEGLAGVLAAHRHLDDVLDARMLLSALELEWRAVQQLAREARGPHADDLRQVAATWTQFYGWLLAEARRDADAVRVLTEAAEQADAVHDGVLAAQVENFRGYLERQRGNPRGIIRHFVAAYHTPGASTLQRVGDAVQAAHGFALLDDRREAERRLAEASELTETVEGEPAPEAAYWLSPEFSRMGIGLAHLALGDRARAADNLRAGLSALPDGHADAEWAAEYRTALEEAVR